MTRASFPIIPSAERTNGDFFLLLVAVLTVLVLIFLLPKSQEFIHWIILVGIHAIIAKHDVDDGASLAFS